MQILFIIIIVMLLSCVIDAAMRSSWNKFYYLKGMSFFTYEIDFPCRFNVKKLDDLIKNENPEKKYKSDIIFNIMAGNAIAFYDKPSKADFGLKKRSYLSILHGVMVYRDGKLTVAGIFDYFALILLPVMLVFLIAFAIQEIKKGLIINVGIVILLLALFIFGFFSTLKKQKKRFADIGELMLKLCSKN